MNRRSFIQSMAAAVVGFAVVGKALAKGTEKGDKDCKDCKDKGKDCKECKDKGKDCKECKDKGKDCKECKKDKDKAKSK